MKTDKCSGCSACYNICPVNAIKMEEDIEGFKYPVIDKTLCTNCGLCEKVCNSDKFINKKILLVMLLWQKIKYVQKVHQEEFFRF